MRRRRRLPVALALACAFAGCGQIVGLRGDYELVSDAGPDATSDGSSSGEGGGETGSSSGGEAGSSSGVASEAGSSSGVASEGGGDTGGRDAPTTTDAPIAVDAAALGAPQLLSPLSSARVTTTTPGLAWKLAPGTDGASIDLCSDRACTHVEQSFVASGSSKGVPTALAAGVHYWRARGTLSGVTGTAVSPTWQLWVGHRSAPRDTSWGAIADFNGDGFAETIVGGNGGGHGAVDVLPGDTLGPLASARVTLTNPSPGDGEVFLGISPAGDVDGDGFVDLTVGAWCTANCTAVAGRAYVFKGGPNGIQAGQSPMTVLTSPTGSGSGFGRFTGPAGDVDGDGYADLVVTSNVGSQGYVYLFFGSQNGPGSAPAITLHTGTVPVDIASVCDFTADGYPDVVASGVGALLLYIGGASGPSDQTMKTMSVPAAAQSSGLFALESSLFVGDVDGDGVCDIVTGAPSAPLTADGGQGPGQAYVYRGQAFPGILGQPQWTLNAPDVGFGFGASPHFVGDANGDGYDDLVIGASAGSGRAYFYPGGPGGPADGTQAAIAGGGSGFGYTVAQAGDINGDGIDDVLVGTNTGDYVDVFFGQAKQGVSSSTPMVPLGPVKTGDWLYQVIW